jgi:hypothetical protein
MRPIFLAMMPGTVSSGTFGPTGWMLDPRVDGPTLTLLLDGHPLAVGGSTSHSLLPERYEP